MNISTRLIVVLFAVVLVVAVTATAITMQRDNPPSRSIDEDTANSKPTTTTTTTKPATTQNIVVQGDDFPKVFTAIVPTPNSNSTTKTGVNFAAEVDFLDVIETGLPSPYTSKGDDFIKISFIVHDEGELKYLQSLSGFSAAGRSADASYGVALELEPSQTQSLHDQVNYYEPDYETRRLQSNYETIPGFSCYKSLQGAYDWLQDMASRSIPNLSIELIDIGDSYLKTQNDGGRDMMVLKITGLGVQATAGRTTEKGIMFVMSGIHAREYSPPELVSRWAESMIDGYGNDADITSILDHTEIHMVVQSNPDGRLVAENNRAVLKRKNMNPSNRFLPCVGGGLGVDLNRNFPFRWGLNTGSSSFMCQQTYRGSAPASEPETQAIVNYVSSIFPTEQRKMDPEGQQQEPFPETANGVFFDIHSFSELIIWPWSHEEGETGNDVGYEAIVDKYKHFNGYAYSGPGNGFLYAASGVTDDWAYGELGASSITFELGTNFYQDCATFENDIFPGNSPALTYAAKSSKAPYSIPKGPDVTSLTVNVSGNSLTVAATASDDAWSPGKFSTSQQGVDNIKIFVNVHPYDLINNESPTSSSLLENFSGSASIDISNLPQGRHMVYVQATDGAGYDGPVTAAFFTKDGSGDGNQSNPTPVPATPAPPTESAECADTDGLFTIDKLGLVKNCDWLAINMQRFEWLCDLLDVATICPLTCQKCDLLSN